MFCILKVIGLGGPDSGGKNVFYSALALTRTPRTRTHTSLPSQGMMRPTHARDLEGLFSLF